MHFNPQQGLRSKIEGLQFFKTLIDKVELNQNAGLNSMPGVFLLSLKSSSVPERDPDMIS